MAKITVPNKTEAENLRTNEKKWSKPLMAAGWNVIPNIIIEKQEALGLDALDMNIILHLSHYWASPQGLYARRRFNGHKWNIGYATSFNRAIGSLSGRNSPTGSRLACSQR